MVREVAPSLSYHYWGLGIRDKELEEEADPLILIRGSEFNHEREIEMQDDEGHMGTATNKISTYRSKASANPSFTDKCRYKEGWEDMWLLLLGSDDGNGNIVKREVTTGVYEYTFAVNVSDPQDPFFATLANGFAKTADDAYVYQDSLLNEFELSGSNEEAPTYTSTFASNYPLVNQANPARVFPTSTIFPKSADVRIYIAPQGDYTEETIAQYEYPCYIEWSFSVNNNVESVPCSGDDFGESTKVLGSREGEVNITVPWTNQTKHLEYEFETGSATGTKVTTDNDVRTVWIIMENGVIGSTEYNHKTIIKIPQVVMTSVTSEQSGSDAKQIELTGNIEESGVNSFITTIITTDLSNLHIDSTSGKEGSLADDDSDIKITVTDGTDAISGATVTIGTDSQTTNASGVAEFSDISHGSVEVTVAKDGYTTAEETVRVSYTNTEFNIVLSSS